MSRPGWAPDCTCGQTKPGYYCLVCNAWAGASYGDQASWSHPRGSAPKQGPEPGEPSNGGGAAADEGPQGPGGESPVRCKNGRHMVRPPRAGEKVLPCGCPLLAAPQECIDKVATLKVTPRRRPIEH